MLTSYQVPTQDDSWLPRHRPHQRLHRSGRPSAADLHRHSFLRKVHQLDGHTSSRRHSRNLPDTGVYVEEDGQILCSKIWPGVRKPIWHNKPPCTKRAVETHVCIISQNLFIFLHLRLHDCGRPMIDKSTANLLGRGPILP